MDPWWTDQQAGLIGGIGGSVVGIFGGIIGILVGTCTPRGKCKRLVYGMLGLGIAVGLIALIVGLVALALQQPWHVWYPLVLIGSLLTVVLGGLAPTVPLFYRQAEMRRLEAEELRRS